MSLPPEDPTPLHQPGGDAAQAPETVRRVIDWYNSRLLAARRDPQAASPEQVAAWRQARDQALDDLERLETADADETVQIALVYAARFRELHG
ncbi:hypothetical protein AB0N17_41460 [Streptomyces sp. NPDC051133]|uniref:hypothetical protein n=1 Tax=Streptomyces sp. NPDC051133 TaxID=3155521 RepID=UPI00342E53F4